MRDKRKERVYAFVLLDNSFYSMHIEASLYKPRLPPLPEEGTLVVTIGRLSPNFVAGQDLDSK